MNEAFTKAKYDGKDTIESKIGFNLMYNFID